MQSFVPPSWFWRPDSKARATGRSNPEQLAVARLDFLALLLDGCGVLFHGLERAERTPPIGLLDLRVHRAQLADVDDELLTFRGEAVELEQPRRIGVRRPLEDRIRPDHEGRAFDRIRS